MNINETNLTKVFIRFLKNEGLYDNFRNRMLKYFKFYDGVIDNILKYTQTIYTKKMKPEYLLDNYYISKILGRYDEEDLIDLLNGESKFQILVSKWKTFLEINDLNKIELVKRNNTYFNYATPIIVSFLIENNALREVTRVLYKRGLIKIQKIQDNDLDKILRKNNVIMKEFFSNELSFCDWETYQEDEPEHTDWYDLSYDFEEYMRNYKNIIP